MSQAEADHSFPKSIYSWGVPFPAISEDDRPQGPICIFFVIFRIFFVFFLYFFRNFRIFGKKAWGRPPPGHPVPSPEKMECLLGLCQGVCFPNERRLRVTIGREVFILRTTPLTIV